MQRAASRAVRDGLHAYDRRHGWRGHLKNILSEGTCSLEAYLDGHWHGPIEKNEHVNGLVLAVEGTNATVRTGRYSAVLTAPGYAWTRRTLATLLRPGDVPPFYIQDISGNT